MKTLEEMRQETEELKDMVPLEEIEKDIKKYNEKIGCLEYAIEQDTKEFKELKQKIEKDKRDLELYMKGIGVLNNMKEKKLKGINNE